MMYRNPVISGFNPDPSICRVGSDYYLVTSSFEYFPGVPIYHSTDLVNWTQIGYCLTRDSQLPLLKSPSSAGIYAPTIRYHNGKFYMITTNVCEMGNFYVTAERPEGPWSDPIKIDMPGIDPSLTFDDDGMVYATSSGITVASVDIETGKLTSEKKHAWSGTGGRHAEAPHLYKIKGKYYLMLAEGGTEAGHMVTIARSDSPWGPFESCPYNPILTHRDRGGHTIQATGHADLFEAHDGTWWAVFLATRVSQNYPPVHHLGRETFLAPVTWDADGWPVIGNNGIVELEMSAPSFMTSELPAVSGVIRDEFDTDTLSLPWNFRRNPNPAQWSLTDRPGSLRLSCTETTFSDMASTGFLGRRQQHFNCRFSSLVDFNPTSDNEEAGLTVIMNDEHHYEIFIKRNNNGKRSVAVRRRIGDLTAIVAEEAIRDAAIVLSISADRDKYQFGYSAPGSEPQIIASGSTRYISTEIAGGFTGVLLGMYATAKHQPSAASAYFDWAEYQFEG